MTALTCCDKHISLLSDGFIKDHTFLFSFIYNPISKTEHCWLLWFDCLFAKIVFTFPVVNSCEWLNKKVWITLAPAVPLHAIFIVALFCRMILVFICARQCAIVDRCCWNPHLKQLYLGAPCYLWLNRLWIWLEMQKNTKRHLLA